MKKNYLILSILLTLIIVAVISNPKKKDHSDKIFNLFVDKENIPEANNFELMALNFQKQAFEEIVYIDNYVLFSIGKVEYGDFKKSITIGVFGNVFVFLNQSELENFIATDAEKNIEKNTDDSKNNPKRKKREETPYESDKDNKNIGDKIYGDFNGDGNFEYAYRKLVKKGYGNPVEDGVPDEYEIRFSNNTIKPIKVDCCWFKLINEGDLNNDGADEITIIQKPMNGCSGMVITFNINNGKYLFEPFTLFWCAEIDDINLERLVVKENNNVFYYEADPNDENLLSKGIIQFDRLIKKKANLR